ncbi:SCO family protein [Nibricoccus sp. IMCC34717]|uniref:SCO family protein n=1 Tax=Nibricoccus sp. IMCC34717 TaxID=3034021 RepID=UPI00384BCD44
MKLGRLTSAIAAFVTGAGLPAFLVAVTVIYEAALVLIVCAPENWGAWSSFAREFKVWCFSYNPRTGGMEWMAVAIMFAEPLAVVGLVLLLWRGKGCLSFRRLVWAQRLPVLAGVFVGVGLVVALYAYGRPSDETSLSLPFPGERIRTNLGLPEAVMEDHRGNSMRLAGSPGRITLVTGVYAQCSTACPRILLDLQELRKSLPEDVRARLDIVALSLNPEYDTRDVMSSVAEAYGFSYPEFKYANGAVDSMRRLLRDLQFAPRKNPDTGVIEHANLFILVDGAGRIAFRFNLDSNHPGWLREAVMLLARERRELAAQ